MTAYRQAYDVNHLWYYCLESGISSSPRAWLDLDLIEGYDQLFTNVCVLAICVWASELDCIDLPVDIM